MNDPDLRKLAIAMMIPLEKRADQIEEEYEINILDVFKRITKGGKA